MQEKTDAEAVGRRKVRLQRVKGAKERKCRTGHPGKMESKFGLVCLTSVLPRLQHTNRLQW